MAGWLVYTTFMTPPANAPATHGQALVEQLHQGNDQASFESFLTWQQQEERQQGL